MTSGRFEAPLRYVLVAVFLAAFVHILATDSTNSSRVSTPQLDVQPKVESVRDSEETIRLASLKIINDPQEVSHAEKPANEHIDPAAELLKEEDKTDAGGPEQHESIARSARNEHEAVVDEDMGSPDGAKSRQIETLWVNPREILSWFRARGARVVLLDKSGKPLAEIDELGGELQAFRAAGLPKVVRDVSEEVLLPSKQYHRYFGLDAHQVLAYLYIPGDAWQQLMAQVDTSSSLTRLELKASAGSIHVREL